jgi:trk system potassium uptake protein TrkH
LRQVLFIIGFLLVTLAGGMVVPAAADIAVGNPDWRVFVGSAAVTAFFGGSLILANRQDVITLTRKDCFLLTTLSWVSLALFAAIPFMVSELRLGLADAFFESMSGLTTTGSTVMTKLDIQPPGILLWRSILQWFGGVGIIVVAIGLLPFMRVAGMQLFKTESSDISDKTLPQLRQVVVAIIGTYLTLTLACALAYWLAGMSGFEAVNHAMTTVSTGGYSTSDDSIGHFKNPAIEWVGIVFMLSGSFPLLIYLRTVLGDRWAIVRDSQIRTLVVLIAGVSLLLGLWLWQTKGVPFADAIRLAFFNVTSVTTTTGYASADYIQWGAFAVGVFFVLIFIGGCSGSTAGGIKIFRFEILATAFRTHTWRVLMPHTVITAFYNNRQLKGEVYYAVMLFVVAYLALTTLGALALAAMGLDLVTALSGMAQAMGNVGPGLGPIIGPAGNFSSLPDGAKWVLAFGMLVGRLELFTVLVLLSPAFWRT